MFDVRLSSTAERVYLNLDRKTQNRIGRIFNQLEQGNFSLRNIISLHGPYKGSLRYRMGDWRIVFRIDYENKKVLIETITTRGGAYH